MLCASMMSWGIKHKYNTNKLYQKMVLQLLSFSFNSRIQNEKVFEKDFPCLFSFCDGACYWRAHTSKFRCCKSHWTWEETNYVRKTLCGILDLPVGIHKLPHYTYLWRFLLLQLRTNMWTFTFPKTIVCTHFVNIDALFILPRGRVSDSRISNLSSALFVLLKQLF